MKLPFRFAPVPDELLFDVDVSAEVKVLWAVIYRLTDPHFGSVSIDQDELGKRLGWPERTLRRHIRKAEERGFVVTIRRGLGRPNEYQAVLPDRPDLAGLIGQIVSPDRPDLAGPSISLEKEKKTDARVPSADASFDAFWTTYPRHTDKGHARPAYARALKRATAEEILAGLTRNLPVLAAQEARFVPHAATWLNGDRWTDEAAKPKAKKHWGEELMEQYQ